MSNITTYQDLIIEKQRLKLLLNEREIEVKAEFADIKTRLKPLKKIVEFAERLTTKDRHNPLLNAGLELGVDLIFKKLLLRKAGFIIKILMPLFVRNYLSHEVAENATWVQKVAHFIRKKIS